MNKPRLRIVLVLEGKFGCGSKPCKPGEHQNRWYMGVHPPQNGGIGYDPWPFEDVTSSPQPELTLVLQYCYKEAR